MSGSPDTAVVPRHYIAVNHHRFHDRSLVEVSVRSAVTAADRLRRARPDEGVAVVLFHTPDGLSTPVAQALRALPGLELRAARTSSNGAGMNAQIDAAERAGATYFYRADADDPVHPDRFVRQADLMDRSGADVSGGGLIYTNLATGARLEVLPEPRPSVRDYLSNCAMLHPTLAFRLSSLRAAGIRYWDRRLEDKHLGLQIARAGLTLVNDPVVYGDYSLNPSARGTLMAARINLSLNWQYLRVTGRWDLAPLALGFFAASVLLPSQWLRRVRHVLRRDARQARAPVRPCSGSAGGSDRGRTDPPPPGSARTDRRR